MYYSTQDIQRHTKMVYTVTNRTIVQHVRGHDDVKIKYDITNDNGETVCAMMWDLLGGKPTVFDNEYDNELQKHTWSVTANGYMWNKHVGYMHSLVAKLSGMDVPDGMSIDHINMYKLDNRRKNLRVATQSQQNSNREARSDKIPPCKELMDKGVMSLPKYVRWDNSESKFVIEKHPKLLQEVTEGKRKKPIMSGTKSKSVSTFEKYQDILARLEQLDVACGLVNDAFAEQRSAYRKEYEEICECINAYENRATLAVPATHIDVPPNEQIVPTRRTADGKKTVSKLPDDCDVKHADIPKYCYYKPASDTRGDKFVIERHPALIATQGKKSWCTTEKKSVSTYDKFQQLLAKYAELETATSSS